MLIGINTPKLVVPSEFKVTQNSLHDVFARFWCLEFKVTFNTLLARVFTHFERLEFKITYNSQHAMDFWHFLRGLWIFQKEVQKCPQSVK